ncbi:MAG: cache domain-containing protein, partial [Cyanobacteria bacterium P01_D01_bin.2]
MDSTRPAKNFPGRQRRLQNKVTALAIALGTLPVLATGSTAYLFASRSIGNQIAKEQIQRTEIIGKKLDDFLVDRQREVESLAANPMLIEKDLRDKLSTAQKHSLLVRFFNALQYFDDIILFDPEGNPIVQATYGERFRGNYGDRSYFQAALKTGKTTMNGPGLSPSSGKLRVEYAVPVTDAVTGDIVYVIRARVPGKQMNRLVDVFDAENSTWLLLDADGIIFAGSNWKYLANSVYSYYPDLSLPTQGKQAGSNVFNNSRENGTRQLISYTSVTFSASLADRSFGALMVADTAVVFAPQHHLLRIFALGTGIAAVVIGAIAALVANRAIRPIQQVTQVAQQVAQGGNLELRAQVKTQDEIGLLATSLNQLIIWIAE